MDLLLQRTRVTPVGIFGELRSPILLLSTLEHAFPTSVPDRYEPKIPAGVYTCVRRRSPKFGYDLFMLKDVPGHDFIEIHRGNFNQDSDGCVLVGLGHTLVSITNSELAFERLMKAQDGINEFQLTVKDAV